MNVDCNQRSARGVVCTPPSVPHLTCMSDAAIDWTRPGNDGEQQRYAYNSEAMSKTVLLVDDDEPMLTALSRVLSRIGHVAKLANSGEQALEIVKKDPVDVVVMDVRMPGRDGLETLRAMREVGYREPVVMMSGESSIDIAVRAVREGALDFIEKPIRAERLLTSVENAIRHTVLMAGKETLAEEVDCDTQSELVGDSHPMRRLRAMIAKAAPTEGRVLITGENGTGKELVARAIHMGSLRSSASFVKLNCAAVPAELIESELFGHEKGAFTGAVTARKGKFELAHRGTLLLDEVGDMPAMMQAKLLRVLQEGEVEPVGGSGVKQVDVRVVAATNRDLEAMVAEGKFREDLYYRLNVVGIHLPPLRERIEDLELLVSRFLSNQGGGEESEKVMGDDALKVLGAHSFPGNVRELKNIVERLVILTDGVEINANDVRLALSNSRGLPTLAGGGASLYREGVALRDLLIDAERGIISDALGRHGGNMTETARALGLERSHLYKKVKALGVPRA